MRPVPQLAIDFVKSAEGCRLTAYRDSRGVWTIGWGHTGAEVREGLTISLAQAVAYLMADLATAAGRLAHAVRADRIAALSEHQYAALVSFVFNLGADPDWRIWQAVNTGQLAAVPTQMLRFDHVRRNGVLVEEPGLTHRRMAEVSLWKTADVKAAVAVVQAAPVAAPPSSETRESETPPAPAPTKPITKSKSFAGATVTAALALVAPAVEQGKGAIEAVNHAIEPYVGKSEVLAHLQGELTIGVAALAVVTLFLTWLKDHEARTR